MAAFPAESLRSQDFQHPNEGHSQLALAPGFLARMSPQRHGEWENFDWALELRDCTSQEIYCLIGLELRTGCKDVATSEFFRGLMGPHA